MTLKSYTLALRLDEFCGHGREGHDMEETEMRSAVQQALRSELQPIVGQLDAIAALLQRILAKLDDMEAWLVTK